jgi:hypothetical protein
MSIDQAVTRCELKGDFWRMFVTIRGIFIHGESDHTSQQVASDVFDPLSQSYQKGSKTALESTFPA